MSAPSEWEIAEAAFDPERLAAMESVFAVGNGRHLLVRSRRLASLEQRHLAAMDYEVVALDVDDSHGNTADGIHVASWVRGQLVEVDMQPAGPTYRLIEGRGLPIRDFGEPLRLTPDTPLHRPATPTRQLQHAA